MLLPVSNFNCHFKKSKVECQCQVKSVELNYIELQCFISVSVSAWSAPLALSFELVGTLRSTLLTSPAKPALNSLLPNQIIFKALLFNDADAYFDSDANDVDTDADDAADADAIDADTNIDADIVTPNSSTRNYTL